MSKSKIDYLMTKSETIPWGGEEDKLTIKAMKMKELLKFADELKKVWEKYTTDKDGEKVDPELNMDFLMEVLQKEPVKLINMIVEENFTKTLLMDAYANDFYNLTLGFKETNFTMLNLLKGTVGRFSQALTAVQKQQKTS